MPLTFGLGPTLSVTARYATLFLFAVALAAAPAAAQDAPKPPAPAAPAPAAPPATAAPAAPGAPAAEAPEVTVPPPEAVVLVARPALTFTAKSNWDDAEKSLASALESIFAAVGKANLKTAGPAMIEYLDSGDDDFQFKAILPVEKAPAEAPGKSIAIGESPAGPALKFVHRGSFEDLEEVYNRIDDYLVSKNLAMKRVYEEYETDPVTTPPEKMVTNIYVVTE